jgi:hypothetical protein
MASAGIILALQLAKPYTIVTQSGVQEQIGYRAILSVQDIVSKVQTTVLFGNDLYSVGLSSNLAQDIVFVNFLKQYSNRPETWVQLVTIPNPPVPYPSIQFQYRPTYPPVASGSMTLLNSGYDPLRGYWVEFLGNYFLHFSIFKDFPGVRRDGPDYGGFQPSQNSPGGNTFPPKKC